MPDVVRHGWTVLAAVSLLALAPAPGAVELSGRFELEPRGFTQSPAHPLELIRFGGHLILWEGGIHHAEIKTAVCAGVPAPDD